MQKFLGNIIYSFFISFGVIIGGSVFAAFGAIINNQPPIKTMLDISKSIKIWAIATALGGTFSSFEILEDGIFKGDIRPLIKQMIFILFSLIGANLGYEIIKLLSRCDEIWRN